MKSYAELSALPAEAYLNPNNFVTDWDNINPAQAKKQYEEGLRIGREANTIVIATNSVWSASLKNGAALTSYEGIGYHAHTASLLKGFLDSGAKVVVYRRLVNSVESIVIQGN